MNRIIVNLEHLRSNLSVVRRWMKARSSSWTVVTKVLCGHSETMKALQVMGVRSIGDSRLENIRAIERITGITTVLLDYSLESLSEGKDATGQVTVKVRALDQVVIGRGADTDIIVASAKAFINALNKAVAGNSHPSGTGRKP